MVIAYHLIATAYGWWLPNDLRGSNSHTLRCDALKQLGEIRFGRKRIQPNSKSIRDFYEHAQQILKHELLEFSNADRQLLEQSFAETIRREGYTCYACAVMRDHAHLCIRKHRHSAEQMIEAFQIDSRSILNLAGLRTGDHPVWGGPGWKVYLDAPADVWRTIDYIDENPIKAGHLPRRYPFVIPYDNWPFHRETASGK